MVFFSVTSSFTWRAFSTVICVVNSKAFYLRSLCPLPGDSSLFTVQVQLVSWSTRSLKSTFRLFGLYYRKENPNSWRCYNYTFDFRFPPVFTWFFSCFSRFSFFYNSLVTCSFVIFFYHWNFGVIQRFPSLRKAVTAHTCKISIYFVECLISSISQTNSTALSSLISFMRSTFLVNKSLWCSYKEQNNTWLLVDMEFLFSCSTQYLTHFY